MGLYQAVAVAKKDLLGACSRDEVCGVIPSCSSGNKGLAGGIRSVSIDVMVSMLALWTGGPGFDTQSRTFNGNNYCNGLRHIYICYLVYEVGIVSCATRCMHMLVHSPQ